jgi:tetratricopeptide (TPR) repeat protein
MLLVAAVLAAVALGVYRDNLRDTRTAERLAMRELGLDHTARGEWHDAMHQLRGYLSEAVGGSEAERAQAKLAYAEARLRTGRADPVDLATLQAVADRTDLAPAKRLAAFHLLAAAHRGAGDPTAAGQVARQALQQFPDDPTCLRFLRAAQEQQGDLDGALRTARHLARRTGPRQLEDRLHLLSILAKSGVEPEALTAEVVGPDQQDTDARTLMLLAVTFDRVGQDQQATACLDQAAAMLGLADTTRDAIDEWDAFAADSATTSARPEQPDVLRLVGLFDGLDRHDRATALLKSAALLGTPRLDIEAAIRASHVGDDATALKLLRPAIGSDDWEAASAAALLGIAADPSLISRLTALADDASTPTPARRAAGAWLDLLEAREIHADDPSGAMRLLLRAAGRIEGLPGAVDPLTTTDPRRRLPRSLLLAMMADALERMLEPAAAREHWRAAARLAPAWPLPALKDADLSLTLGDFEQAADAAEKAQARARLCPPQGDNFRKRASHTAARVAYARWRVFPDDAQTDAVHHRVTRHLAAWPQDDRVLPWHAHVLAVERPDAARNLVRHWLDDDSLRSTDVRLDLAEISRVTGLGLEDELLAGVDDRTAARLRTPTVDGQGQLLETQRALLASPNSAPADLVTAASWITRHAPARAHDAWLRAAQAAVDDPPSAARVLEEAEVLRSSESGRRALAELVDTLFAWSGGESGFGRLWRVHDARLLLDEALAVPPDERSRDRRHADLLAAAERLKRIAEATPPGSSAAEARRLLGETLLVAGHPEAALGHLRLAYETAPDRLDIGLRWLGLLERQGRWDEADQVFQDLLRSRGRIASGRVEDPNPHVELAMRLGWQGRFDRSIALLRDLEATVGLPLHGRRLLCEHLERAGLDDEARLIHDRLLVEAASPAVVLDAALFHHRQGRASDARRLVDQQASPMLQAAFEAATGRAASAVRQLEASITADPSREIVDKLMRIELARGRPDRALQAAGIVRDPDPRLRLLAAAARVERTGDRNQLAAALSHLPRKINPWDARLGEDLRGSDDQSSGALWLVTSVLPDASGLTHDLVERLTDAGRADRAAAAARRAADRVPASVGLQRLAFRAIRRTEAMQTPDGARDALWYARQWRRALPAGTDTLEVDAAAAEALLAAGRPAEAAALVDPYVQSRSIADGLSPIHLLAAEARARVGDPEGALSVLLPFLYRDDAHGRRARTVTVRLAGRRLTDPDEAHRWLRTVAVQLDRLPAGGSVSESVELAVAWAQVGTRFDDPKAIAEAETRLGELTARDLKRPVAVRVWSATARLAGRTSQQTSPESAWRRVLAIEPTNPTAALELARLLIRDDPDAVGAGGSAEPDGVEAARWARVAVSGQPGSGTAWELLARARQASGDAAGAEAAFVAAIEADRKHLGALVGLAHLRMLRTSEEVEPEVELSRGPTLARLPAERHTERLYRRAAALFEQAETWAVGVDGSGWPESEPVPPRTRREFEALARVFDGPGSRPRGAGRDIYFSDRPTLE